MLTLATLIRFELRSLLRDPTILLTLFGGILLYSFLVSAPLTRPDAARTAGGTGG